MKNGKKSRKDAKKSLHKGQKPETEKGSLDPAGARAAKGAAKKAPAGARTRGACTLATPNAPHVNVWRTRGARTRGEDGQQAGEARAHRGPAGAPVRARRRGRLRPRGGRDEPGQLLREPRCAWPDAAEAAEAAAGRSCAGTTPGRRRARTPHGAYRARRARGPEIPEAPRDEVRGKVRQGSAPADRQGGRLRFIVGNCMPTRRFGAVEMKRLAEKITSCRHAGKARRSQAGPCHSCHLPM